MPKILLLDEIQNAPGEQQRIRLAVLDPQRQKNAIMMFDSARARLRCRR
jgi:predicted AAA+ superfamily ATPase